MKKDTMKNKSQLAKLLATENIEVQENAVKTASFDVKNRILTVPIFKEEHKSKHVYDMLVGHEVAHALHTPSDSWEGMGNRAQELGCRINKRMQAPVAGQCKAATLRWWVTNLREKIWPLRHELKHW